MWGFDSPARQINMKNPAIIIKDKSPERLLELGFLQYPPYMGMGMRTLYHYFPFPEQLDSMIKYYESDTMQRIIARDKNYRDYLKQLGLTFEKGKVVKTEDAMRSLRLWQFYVDYDEKEVICQVSPSDVRFPASFVHPDIIMSTEKGKEIADKLISEGIAEIGEADFEEGKKAADA